MVLTPAPGNLRERTTAKSLPPKPKRSGTNPAPHIGLASGPGAHFKKLRLTSRNLRLFDKRNRRRNLPRVAPSNWAFVPMAKGESSKMSGESRSGSQATVDSEHSSTDSMVSSRSVAFNQLARRNGIIAYDHRFPLPSPIRRLAGIFDQERHSPKPEKRIFDAYVDALRLGTNETDSAYRFGTLLNGELLETIPGYRTQAASAFKRFPKEQGLNNGVAKAVPDLVQGFGKARFDPDGVLAAIEPFIVPSGHADGDIMLAHLVGEFKVLGGDVVCGARQVRFAAACLVEGRDRANEFLGSVDEAGTAHVAGFVFDGEGLRLSVHFSVKIAAGRKEFREHLIFDGPITASYESFVSSHQRVRNMQEWALDNALAMQEKVRATTTAQDDE